MADIGLIVKTIRVSYCSLRILTSAPSKFDGPSTKHYHYHLHSTSKSFLFSNWLGSKTTSRRRLPHVGIHLSRRQLILHRCLQFLSARNAKSLTSFVVLLW